MQYAVNDGQSIFDIVLQTVGSIEDTYALLSANPHIDNIDYDFNSNPNVILTFTPSPSPTPATLNVKPVVISTTSSIYGRDGQSLFDIVLMTTGSIDTMYKDIIIPNNISEADTIDVTGILFTFNNVDIKDQMVYNHFKQKNYVINTGSKTLVLATENGNYLVTESGFIILI